MECITKPYYRLLAISILLMCAGPGKALAQFGNWFGPGELSKPHEELKGVSSCTKCHASGTPHEKCLDCHKEIKERLDRDVGYHAIFKPKKCPACHQEHKGRNHDIFALDLKTFKHDDTGWPLTGAHDGLKCENCHKQKRVDVLSQKKTKSTTYLGANAACVSCHKDVHKGKFGVECEGCHLTTSWKPKPTPTPGK